MRTRILILLTALISLFIQFTNVYSQYTGAQYRGQSLVPANLEINDVSGQPLKINDHSNIEGSPLFSNTWTPALITLSDGKVYYDSSINYSTFDNELFVKRDSLMYPVNNVSKFTLQFTGDSNADKLYHFSNGFPKTDNNSTSSFYQVLCDGKKIQLLKHYHTSLNQVYNYGGRFEQTYSTFMAYYVFLPVQNKMVYLGTHINIKTLHKKLPEYDAAVHAFLEKNKVDLKEDMNAAALFTFLNNTGSK